MITKFNTLFHFFYDIYESNKYFSKIKDKNGIKLTNIELIFLKSYIKEKNVENEILKGDQFLK